MNKQMKPPGGEQITRLEVERPEKSAGSGILDSAAMIGKTCVMLVSLICLAGYGKVQAESVTYTFSGIGSGSFGANAFSDVAFTITSTADTSLIVSLNPGVLFVPNLTATVSVFGLGSAAFIFLPVNVNNQNLSRVGISDRDQQLAILFIDNPACSTYDLSTSIGPLAGAPIFNSSASFGTTAGAFSLTSISTASFEAFVQPVPEPSTLGLLGLGATAVCGCLWRKHRQRKA